MKYTKEQVAEKLAKNQTWLERGVLAIYERQTADEQDQHATKHVNGRGFSGCDAGYLSYIAKWLLDGKKLNGKHLAKTRKRMTRYAGQLTLIANEEV